MAKVLVTRGPQRGQVFYHNGDNAEPGFTNVRDAMSGYGTYPNSYLVDVDDDAAVDVADLLSRRDGDRIEADFKKHNPLVTPQWLRDRGFGRVFPPDDRGRCFWQLDRILVEETSPRSDVYLVSVNSSSISLQAPIVRPSVPTTIRVVEQLIALFNPPGGTNG